LNSTAVKQSTQSTIVEWIKWRLYSVNASLTC